MPAANTTNANSPAIGRKRLGGLRGALDVVHAVDVQRRGAREDDEEGDDVRRAHAQVGIDVDAMQLRGRLPRRADQGPGAALASRSSTSCDACQKNSKG
jgi:hypothetical protein